MHDIKKMEEKKNEMIEMLEMIDSAALTGLLYDYVVGNSSSVFVPRRALVHALIMFGLGSADVHHQGPRVGLHGHVGVLVDVKVGPISGPRETEGKKQCHNVNSVHVPNIH